MALIGWRELPEGVGKTLGAIVVVAHRRAEVGGRWRVASWGTGELPALAGWSPPAWSEADPPVQQALAEGISPTDPLLGLGPLPPAAAEALRARLTHGVLLGLPLDRRGALVLWAGLPAPPAPERLEGTLTMIRALSAHEDCRARHLLDALPLVFIAADMEGHILDCNERVSLMGYEPEEVRGQHGALFFMPGERERMRAQLMQTPAIQRLEIALKHRSGERLVADLSLGIVFDEEHQPLEILSLGRDVRPQRELNHHRRLEAVSRMVSGVAHELNNPLQTVVGNAEMLAGMKLPGTAQRRAQGVLSGARRCQEVVDGLLRMKIQHRELDRWVQVEALVERAIRQAREELVLPGVEVELQGAPVSAVVRGADRDLEQALLAILRNALQAADGRPAGRVSVSIEVGEREVCIRIADNGQGMPPEVIERAFEPFFTTREVGAGRGLGLSIALGILHEHGGSISITSGGDPRQEGTTVLVTLPLVAG